MATLTIPHSFTAGTPALASEVNANFQAIVNWTQSNIGTDNLGILTARSVALPSAPTLAILSLSQNASQPVISISNQGTDNPISINQSGVFATGKGAIVINDPTAQTISGAAHLLMSLSNASTVPAIKIDHGTPTMSLTKTQLDLFNGAVQATSAGVVSMTTVNATTVAATDVNTTNVTATGLLDLTAPASDAIVAEIKGRSSDNNAIVQFKSNDDATVYVSATSSPSGLTLNLPDTADSYTFQINGIPKVTIDDTGLTGLGPAVLTESNFSNSTSYVDTGVFGFSPSHIFGPGWGNIFSFGTVVVTQPRMLLLQMIPQPENQSGYCGIRSTTNAVLYWRILITGPGGFSYSCKSIGGTGLNTYPSGWNSSTPIYNSGTAGYRFTGNTSQVWNDGTFRTYVDGSFLNGTEVIFLPAAGTYNITMQAGTTVPGESCTMHHFRLIKQIML